jgi:hypothetical protein
LAFNPVSKIPGAIANFPQEKKPGFCCEYQGELWNRERNPVSESPEWAIAFLEAIAAWRRESLFLGMRYPSYNVLRVILEN